MSEPGFSLQDKGKGTIKKNVGYYIESDVAVFKVENCLFRLPTHMFIKESPHFSEIFGLCPNEHKDTGSCEDEATYGEQRSRDGSIVDLKGIKRNEFKSLLKVLYPLNMTNGIKLSKSEWVAVLYVSTEWNFCGVRQLAIGELHQSGSLSPVEKVVLGRKLFISSWVEEGLSGMVRREQPISDDEGVELDSHDDVLTALKVSWIREGRLTSTTPLQPGWETMEINREFKEELCILKEDEDKYMNPADKRRKEALACEKALIEEAERKKRKEAKRKANEELLRKAEAERVEKMNQEERDREKQEEHRMKAGQLREFLSAARVATTIG
ncbi:hypothetical protein CPC08DRAFT_712351 [Agrocybe pediades]|nr:hypothetical protein CPC08DRAFT_712351 [Agrocybe pediades]